ncbi:MAG TPA: hypothetical protein VIK91_13995 [Nannocystis sp.]
MEDRRPNLWDYLNDAQERPLLEKALQRPLGDAERLHYASIIAARDPQRAEWLRLEVTLRAAASAEATTRARFEALSRACAPDWVRLLTRASLLNCGRARDESPRIRFAFVCERRWESLAPTGDVRIRACDECRERVHHCASVREAEAHARAGHCIAVPPHLVADAGGMNDRYITGRPDPLAHWARRIFGEDD